MRLLMLIVFFSLVACSSGQKATPLTKEGEKVDVISKQKAKRCKVIGQVTGENEFGSEDVATNEARNEAADMGGDAIYVKDTVMNGSAVKVIAFAYKCD